MKTMIEANKNRSVGETPLNCSGTEMTDHIIIENAGTILSVAEIKETGMSIITTFTAFSQNFDTCFLSAKAIRLLFGKLEEKENEK